VVALSSFGALDSCLYLSARQFYATARDGLFPALLARTNAKSAPHYAIMATGAWTVALIAVMSSFATLVNYLSAAIWLYCGLVGVAVVVSRRGDPGAVRRGGETRRVWRERGTREPYTPGETLRAL
jgi:APA family basic amino acid/polyamine antiporter